MSKLLLRTLWISLATTISLGVATSAHPGQSDPNIGGIVGVILNSAVADQARREWQNRPVAEYNCLAARNISAAQLAASGIGPNDPRVQGMFAQCGREASPVGGAKVSPVTTTTTGRHNRDFAVDGLAVGAAVYPNSAAYSAYTCSSSDQFTGFKWCTTKHTMIGKFGPYDSSLTILHSDADLAVFVLQDILPAYFAVGDTEQEIQRISRRFGQSAHVLHGDPRPEAPHSIIASWGDVTLTPLDDATMDALRNGKTINAGLLIDYLGDAKKSALEGLPVFHMGGGPGYIWAAKFDDSGRGGLRITAVNPSLLPGGAVEHAPASVPANARTQATIQMSPREDVAGYVNGGFTYRLTKESFNPATEIIPRIKSLYGQQAILADWDELKSLINTDSKFKTFVADADLPLQRYDLDKENILIQKSGNEYSQGMHFLLLRHDGSVPSQFAVLDSINHHAIDLGRWNHIGKALIKLPNASESATSRETGSPSQTSGDEKQAADQAAGRFSPSVSAPDQKASPNVPAVALADDIPASEDDHAPFGLDKPMPYVIWGRDAGDTLAIGTVATADEICEVLNHPIFFRSDVDIDNALGVQQGLPVIDTGALGSKWIFGRIDQFRPGFLHSWKAKDVDLINRNLSDCLRNIATRDRKQYDYLVSHYFRYLINRSDGSVPLCYENVPKYQHEKSLAQDGTLKDIVTPIVASMPCAKLTDQTDYLSSIMLEGPLTDRLFLAMLTLKEANPALKTILDQANARLPRPISPAEGKAKAEANRRQVQEEGEKFRKDHDSVWAYTETKDEMSGAVVAQVHSSQTNNEGIAAEITGYCATSGIIELEFLATITDDQGKPTISVIGGNDHSAAVRYRLNDTLQDSVLPTSQFDNRFDILEILGPEASARFSASGSDQGAHNMANALLSLVGVNFLAQFNKIWGALVDRI
jgi:hypothetical protein